MEVLAGLAIISVVSSVVLPGVGNFYSGTRVKADAEIFVQHVRLARYRAISEQAVHRMIFDVDPATAMPSAFRVQTHMAFDEDSGVAYGPSTFDTLVYNSANWLDIGDGDEVCFDAGLTIATDLPQAIYFWPNGQIYEDPNIANASISPIAEHYIAFSYGSAGIKVIVTQMGVFSSEAYAADMVNPADDSEVLW